MPKDTENTAGLDQLKKMSSIAKRFPRVGGARRGVSVGTIKKHIDSGRLQLGQCYYIDGVKHYLFSVGDLGKTDWGLKEKYKPKKRGRPTNRSKIGLE